MTPPAPPHPQCVHFSTNCAIFLIILCALIYTFEYKLYNIVKYSLYNTLYCTFVTGYKSTLYQWSASTHILFPFVGKACQSKHLKGRFEGMCSLFVPNTCWLRASKPLYKPLYFFHRERVRDKFCSINANTHAFVMKFTDISSKIPNASAHAKISHPKYWRHQVRHPDEEIPLRPKHPVDFRLCDFGALLISKRCTLWSA